LINPRIYEKSITINNCDRGNANETASILHLLLGKLATKADATAAEWLTPFYRTVTQRTNQHTKKMK